jgi:hypothetical protein
MKRTRIIGLCLVAVCALFALVASSASAEKLPEYGKCEAQTGGKFDSASCTKVKAGKETDEWHPLTTAVKFTSKKVKNTGNAVLESEGGTEISCEEQVEKQGEYGPGNLVKNIIGEFSKCTALGANCNSNGEPSGFINTLKLHGEPGIVEKNATKSEKDILGNDLRGEESEFLAEFSCGPAPVLVRGGVVVKAESKAKSIANKMEEKIDVEFVAEKPGKQVPEVWQPNGAGVSNSGGPKTITEHLEGKVSTKPYERSGQSLTTEQKSEVKKVKVELRECEQSQAAC